ncbi:MAG: rubredoxin [Planctomycetota bacterium]
MSVFAAEQISDQVYWVGAVDWGLREFHGYQTGRGTTYNAFLIIDETVTLIDTVRAPFHDELLARIASVIDPTRIDQIVSLHAEMDHSGCLPAVVERVRPQRVYASRNGVAALAAHGLTPQSEIIAVEDGATIELGRSSLRFINTPMLHWPDSMFAYLTEANILFSQDGFGMHLASNERYVDELEQGVVAYEAAKYFANILLPYAGLVGRTVARLESLGLPLAMIAPDHGPLWRDGGAWIIPKYREWAEQVPTEKVVVCYHTMWGSTERMAHAVVEGLRARGLRHIELTPLAQSHRSDVATHLLDAGALVVGTSTLNKQQLPLVADVLCYLTGLQPRNLTGAVFGSHGWSGGGTAQVATALRNMGVELVADPLDTIYVPDTVALEACEQLGEQVAAALQGGAHTAGSTPTPAPESATAATADPQPARCTVCGWVYDPAAGLPDQGIAPGTPFAALSDDFVCPICRVGKDKFVLI